jgi:hypothetical protein
MELGHAEVEQVWPRDGRVLVTGRIVGAVTLPEAEQNGELTLTSRARPSVVLTCPATLDGHRFRASFAVDLIASAVAPAPAQIRGREIWDLHLRLPGESHPLRVGRHLDDIANKKKVMTFPAQTGHTLAGPVSVKPYYTDQQNLSLICRAA